MLIYANLVRVQCVRILPYTDDGGFCAGQVQ